MSAMTLSADEKSVLNHLESQGDSMIADVRRWSAINSGSRNADGLERMRGELETAFSRLDARMEAVELQPSETVTPDGEIRPVEYTPALKVSARPRCAGARGADRPFRYGVCKGSFLSGLPRSR